MKTINPSRRRFLKVSSLLSLPIISLAGSKQLFSAGSADKYGIKGQQAPDLDIDYWIDANGQQSQFSQQQLKNKWVYLKCFQNWCPGCHKYGFPALKKVADAFHQENRVEVLAVQTVFEGFASNTKESIRELQIRYQLPIMMGHDPGDPAGDHHPRTMRDYRTGGTPWVVIISPEGQVIYNDFHIDAEKFISYLEKQLG
ncbi:MAG: redoxin domain-containing protein [Candidatus Thiodiazotropha sp. (ex Lucinoma annulata)]|nr:redoxin domain-containing protein [Candidatus Thiodiazotropha sp. (ex Lucinoma annulata)]